MLMYATLYWKPGAKERNTWCSDPYFLRELHTSFQAVLSYCLVEELKNAAVYICGGATQSRRGK